MNMALAGKLGNKQANETTAMVRSFIDEECVATNLIVQATGRRNHLPDLLFTRDAGALKWPHQGWIRRNSYDNQIMLGLAAGTGADGRLRQIFAAENVQQLRQVE